MLQTPDALTVGGLLTPNGGLASVDRIGLSRFVVLAVDDPASTTEEPIGASGVDEFTLSVVAGAVYVLEAFLRVGCSAANDAFIAVTAPASSVVMWSGWAPSQALTGTTAAGDVDYAAITAAGNYAGFGGNDGTLDGTSRPVGTIRTVNAGNVGLVFRAGTGAATVKANSWMKLTRVG